jgi:hypothetical protein
VSPVDCGKAVWSYR